MTKMVSWDEDKLQRFIKAYEKANEKLGKDGVAMLGFSSLTYSLISKTNQSRRLILAHRGCP